MKKYFLLTIAMMGLACAQGKPNVIIVMTDDQGYGDLGCHGNPVLKTPNIDAMYADSVRLDDYHVSSFCTPTRASLMTGNYPAKTGAYRTAGGRSSMYANKKTMADLFADNNYVTGMVGKWHLGDNAPHRPQDRGFQHVLWHRAGGIGQAADYYGNDYYDDYYERASATDKQGKFEQFKGYCTDVWFEEGMNFIEKNKEKPFFLYLSLNAPHGPYFVPEEWAKPYQGVEGVANPNFYGMIANIDHNMGLLRDQLAELDIADNTILIFTTDNGTAAGAKFNGLESEAIIGYNAGLRGKKSSIYQGGIRVPFFVHWPKGGLVGGKDIETLTAHIDILPTLAELSNIEVPSSYDVDGLSLKLLLDGKKDKWTRNHLIVQYHGGAGNSSPYDVAFADTAVLTERWRLVNSKKLELYDITADKSQRVNLALEYPEVIKELKTHYDNYWDSIYPDLMTPANIDLGNLDQNPTELCSQDWLTQGGNPPWNFGNIRKLPKVNYPWMVNVKQAGKYRFTLRQWPELADKPLIAAKAKVSIAGVEKEVEVPANSKEVIIELELPIGKTELWTYLTNEKGQVGGAYFTTVEAL